uniref:CACTA en-spm transposon protein n=1 Tax=Cucumis melo TaxID=3656 RepID=A0A9I9E6Q5_CUCME
MVTLVPYDSRLASEIGNIFSNDLHRCQKTLGFPTVHAWCWKICYPFSTPLVTVENSLKHSRRITNSIGYTVELSTSSWCVGSFSIFRFSFVKDRTEMKERRQDKSQPSPLSCPSFPSPPRSSFSVYVKIHFDHLTVMIAFSSILYELAKQRGKSINCMELLRKTHVRDETFVLQAAEDTHFLNLLLVSKFVAKSNARTPVPAYPSGNEICETPKARRTTSASSAMASCSQSIIELQLRAALDEAMLRIEEQKRNHDALALEVERIWKLKEDMSRAQQGPPHDP